MKRFVAVLIMTLAVLLCTASAQSLGEAARKVKSQKKPATDKVYTNDDFSSQAPVVKAAEKESAPTNAETDAKTKDNAEDAAKVKSAKASEWKQKLEEQKKAVADLERELNLMEREHQVRVATYYADAGNQLRDSKKWFEDEKKYEDDHAAKQKALADGRQRLDDLQESARKAGMSGN
jgi:hypothetical protein